MSQSAQSTKVCSVLDNELSLPDLSLFFVVVVFEETDKERSMHKIHLGSNYRQ